MNALRSNVVGFKKTYRGKCDPRELFIIKDMEYLRRSGRVSFKNGGLLICWLLPFQYASFELAENKRTDSRLTFWVIICISFAIVFHLYFPCVSLRYALCFLRVLAQFEDGRKLMSIATFTLIVLADTLCYMRCA